MSHRPGLKTAPDAGVEGNARLTATTGVLLIGLLLVEGVTVLQVRQMITLHIFLGIVLLGPALLKTASTVYRFARYYAGGTAYVHRGPPSPIQRLLGPFVIVLTLVVIGTGIGLLAVRPGQGGLLLTAHKASFVLWFGVMTIHVLGHVREAATTSWREWRPRAGDRASTRRAVRAGAVIIALVAGVGLAAALMPSASAWTSDRAVLQEDR